MPTLSIDRNLRIKSKLIRIPGAVYLRRLMLRPRGVPLDSLVSQLTYRQIHWQPYRSRDLGRRSPSPQAPERSADVVTLSYRPPAPWSAPRAPDGSFCALNFGLALNGVAL
jgi:hypothetical protein